MQYFSKYGIVINYETGEINDKPYFINNYMSRFFLSQGERDYYKEVARKDPSCLYAYYFLYMDAKERSDSLSQVYLKQLEGKLNEELLTNAIFIDPLTKAVKTEK